jgi:hypothetical protein
MVFVFIIAIVLVAVGGLAANAAHNSSNVRAARTTTQDAETAVTIAMEYLRYNFVSGLPQQYVGSPPSCLPAGHQIPSADPGLTTSNPVSVYCTETVDTASAQSRVVEFYACGTGIAASACTGNTVLLHAEVTYDDLDLNGNDHCTSPGDESSCGGAMAINTWDIVGDDT